MTQELVNRLTRPIVGIENRTPQEAFDIMVDRITRAAAALSAQPVQPVVEQRLTIGDQATVFHAGTNCWYEAIICDAKGRTTATPKAPSAVTEAMVEAFKDVLAHLVAAHSLLLKSPKTGAASNRMFDRMVADYGKSIDRGRAALQAALEARP